jgi:hypothetical protein
LRFAKLPTFVSRFCTISIEQFIWYLGSTCTLSDELLFCRPRPFFFSKGVRTIDKYTKTEALDPVTNQSVSLFHPREMIWEEHFTWNEDVTQAIGITPVGRATIALLQINRDGVINMRRVLAIMGYHSPD